MKLVKQIGYKLIVTMCIVMTFCCFLATTPVDASRVNTNDYYYTGIPKGSYTVEKNFFAKVVEAFGSILGFLAGTISMAIRIVPVGWTAFAEWFLTAILEGAAGEKIEIEKVDTANITGSDNYITLDAIFFNRVPLLDINVFNFEMRDDVTPTGLKKGKTEEHKAPMIIYTEEIVVQGDKNNFNSELSVVDEIEETEVVGAGEPKESLIIILKKAIAGWYYTFRLISIMIMLVILVYIGIQLAIQSSVTQKALYKRVLLDWVVGMILVFSIHYIMIAIIQFNEMLVEQISSFDTGVEGSKLEVYEYGLEERAKRTVENEEVEMTLYEEVKTRAYDAKLTVGTTGMIMYMVLVYYAYKYTFIYLKRYLTVAVLVIMAPIVAVSYAINKVKSGKSAIFTKWLKEFFFIVILQSIHALMYVMFVDTALKISLRDISGMLMAFVMFNFMCKAEGIFRKIFNITGKLTEDASTGKLEDIKNAISGAALGVGASKLAVKATKTAAKIATKPIRSVAGAGFGKAMELKANSQWYKDRAQKSKEKNAERVNKLKLGSVAKEMQNGNLDGEKLRQEILKLKKDIPFSTKDADGNVQILSDEEYIKEFNKNADQYSQDYDKLTTKRALAGHYIKGKWKEIMDPYQYVEKVKQEGKEEEKEIYRVIATKREYGSIGKKVDSVGTRFANKTSMDNLLGLDAKTKAALKKQTSFIKEELIGFGSLLMGLPMLVANPTIGMGLLAKGIHSASLFNNRSGKARERNLRGYAILPNGKYQFVRFDGKSPVTIAEGAQFISRHTIRQIERGKVELDENMVKRLKKSRPKLAERLGSLGSIGAAAGTTLALSTVVPVTLPIAALGITTGVLTGNIVRKRGASNVYMALQDTVREAKKADDKAWKSEVKDTENFLDEMAKAYLALEAEKQAYKYGKHTQKFEDLYSDILDTQNQEVEEMDDATLRRETGYEEPFEIEMTEDGNIKLSGDTERNLIDNAIIEIVEKSGITDIQSFELSASRIQDIDEKIHDELVKRKIIGKNESTEKVIDNLKKKVKDRKTVLDKERPQAVEDKMTDDAIIETMRAHNFKDPRKVNPEEVMDRLKEKRGETTEGTANVAANMQAQKPKTMLPNNTDNIDNSMYITAIQARQTILADKARQNLDGAVSAQLKQTLKRKKNLELTSNVLDAQDKLEQGKSSVMDLNNERNSDKVLQLLKIQTEMHKTKEEYRKVETFSKESKTLAMAAMFSTDGSIKVNTMRDGSRRVPNTNDRKLNESLIGTSMDDLLKSLNRKQNI